MCEGREREREGVLMRMEGEVKEERRARAEWEMRARVLEKELYVAK